MNNTVTMNLFNFSLAYLLLIFILFIMKKAKIKQTKLLLLASFRMTLQLMIAGFVLTYIFKNPNPVFLIIYLGGMIVFTVNRVLSKNKGLNPEFKRIIAGSITISGIIVLLFFIIIVANKSILNPQYVIPIAGMIMGNTMNGVSLGIKTFRESLKAQQTLITTLLNMGVKPTKILMPFVNQALETAMLPRLNNMVGMGIVTLPGMMTGQILSGTLPSTAVLYQIAIMLAITAVVSSAVFFSLYLGHRTLYNERNQIIIK